MTHQLDELEEVGHAAGVLERLVELFALAAHVDVLPELVAQRADPSDRLLQSRGVPRHPALVPHHATELAVESVDRLPTARPKEAADPLVHLTLNLAERRDRKSTRLNSSHSQISYAVFCLKKKKKKNRTHKSHTPPS